jgi:S1-C subfamily serine protease
MQLRCPGCRADLSIPEGLADRTVRCRYCDLTFRPIDERPRIRAALPAAPPVVRPVSTPARPAPRRDDDEPRSRPRRRRSSMPLLLLIPFLLVALFGLVLVLGAVGYFAFGSKSDASSSNATLTGLTEHGTIPAETLDRIKAMTVFVKVDAGALQGSGSGFLIKVDGDTGYLVTNDHVANPRDDDDRRGRRLGPRFPRGTPRLTVVLNSGTAFERSVSATQLIADSEKDLAILRIKAPNLPQPLDLADHAQLVETMPVFIIGFPFGEELGLKRNPAVNVARATVTSIRRDRANKPALVQLQGELHPGNSGGPVVDAQGRLIGVAVAKLEGTQIGFAIAPTVLEDLLRRGR